MARQGRRWPIGFLFAAYIAVFLAACESKPKGPIRSIENGVEVVDNGSGYYSVPGQPQSLSLKEEFRIDLEDEALSAVGLTDIVGVDADSKGRIYLFRSMRTQGPLVFQFDAKGGFIRSFGAMGQGPGEAQYPVFLGISPMDEIRVLSHSPDRFLVFNGEGRLIRESGIAYQAGDNPYQIESLVNGTFLARHYVRGEGGYLPSKTGLGLYDIGLKRIVDIRDYDVPNAFKPGLQIQAYYPILGVSGSAFYVNWGAEGRDIAVFDLEGRMKRIIRADFPSHQIPPDYKKDLFTRIPKGGSYQQTRAFIQALETFPVFQAFISDEKGRLFVTSFEKDPESEANLCDVFSPDGVRILRAGLGYQDLLRYMMDSIPFDVVLKNGRAYCVREKESGYKEVVVFRMIWN